MVRTAPKAFAKAMAMPAPADQVESTTSVPKKDLVFTRVPTKYERKIAMGQYKGQIIGQWFDDLPDGPAYIWWMMTHVRPESSARWRAFCTFAEQKYFASTDNNLHEVGTEQLIHSDKKGSGLAGSSSSSTAMVASSRTPTPVTPPPGDHSAPAKQLLDAAVIMGSMADHVYQEAAGQIDTLPEGQRPFVRYILQTVYDSYIMTPWDSAQ